MSRRISEATIREVDRRDQGCVAALYLGAPDVCRDRWGQQASPYDRRAWEHDHVGEMRMGKAAEGTPEHLVIVCSWHHQHSREWRATSHREDLRRYVALVSAGMPPRLAGRKVLTDIASTT